MSPQFYVGLVLLIIPIAWLGYSVHRMFEGERRGKRSPFTEKLIRPAGESLRIRIGAIEELMMDRVLWLVPLFIAPGILAMSAPLHSVSGRLLFHLSLPAVCWAFAVYHYRNLTSLRIQLRKLRLGFDGERYVGGELDQLMLEGYGVFHDFVIDSRPGGDLTDFNIDHIAVGPTGIVSVETKAKRKPTKDQLDSGRAEVEFDGNTLKFSCDKARPDAVDQALNNAKELGEWLNERLAFKVNVRAMIVIPGWWVENPGNRDAIHVYTGKGVAQKFSNLPKTALSPAELEAVTKLLGSHARNVDAEAPDQG